MLHHMSRRGRVDAMLKDGLTSGDSSSGGLAQILQPKEASVDYAPSPVSPGEVAAILKNAPDLPLQHYNALLFYLQSTGRQYRHFHQVPHPQNALILPPRAERPLQMRRGDCTFSCQRSHEGNSALTFYNPTHKNPKPDLLSYFGGSRSRVLWKHFWLFARISGCPCSQKQTHHFNNIRVL
jgi:hypothetical protein